jgi:transcription antitermination factor NusG
MGNLQWHALQVRPHFERIVGMRLGQRGIEQFVPLRQIGRHPNSLIFEAPLFPAYVLCKSDAKAVSSFWDIPGVLSPVRGSDQIDIVPEQQIVDLRRILASRLPAQSWPFTPEGIEVMIEDGPLSGVTGILEGKSDKRLLILSIRLIRRSIAVKIDRLFQISFRSGAALPTPGRSFLVRERDEPEQQWEPLAFPNLKCIS